MKKRSLIVIAAVAMFKSALIAQYVPANVPQSGLLGYWPLDTIYNANDSWVTTDLGTTFGSVHTTDRFGMVSGAYKFNGTSNYILTGFSGVLGTRPRAVSFWAKTPGNAGVGMYAVGWGSNGNGERFACGVDYPANRAFAGGGNCLAAHNISGSGTSDNKWHHYVFQFSGTSPANLASVQIYQDAVYVGATIVGTPSYLETTLLNTLNAGGAYNVNFGRTPYTTAPAWFTGSLDDIGIWGRLLDTCEIKKLFNGIGCCSVSNPKGREQQQISELTAQLNALTDVAGKAGLPVELSDKNIVVLDQNVPNPFAESTVITYNIPIDFKQAQLIFINSEGKVINTVNIVEKGYGKLNIFANDLSHGLYSYRLVVDGKTIDSKKMIKD